MQSKTSFFDRTVLKKDITRYAPVWGVYTITLLLALFGLSEGSMHTMARDVLDTLKAMSWVNLLYAGVCGAFLFMDLFNGRLCNALHAFPLRRENWLATHILSGFLFSFIPNLLVSLLGSIILWDFAYIAFIWLAVTTLQFLFFFGSAVLCAVCAGNLIGMAAIYGIFHFITFLIYQVIVLLYQPLLYGIRMNPADFYRFFPLSQMSDFNYAIFTIYHNATEPYGEFQGFVGKDWLYLGICAAAGLGSMVLAWLVYRRRHLESAGDLLSLKKLSPVFLIICTIGAGAFLYLFSEAFGDESYAFLVIGMVIGYFAGRMLLGRTVKVFTKKAFLHLGILTAVLAGSLLVTWLDPLGVTQYVPEIDKIKSAVVVGADKGGYNYFESSLLSYDERYEEHLGYAVTDQEDLADLQDFHRQLTQYRPNKDDGTLCNVRVFYTLENGRTVRRYYEVGRNSALGIRAGKYFSDMRYIFEVNDTAILYEVMESAVLDFYTDKQNINVKLTDQQEIAGLLDAIAADCEAGTMAQNWAYHNSQGKYDDAYYIEFRGNNTAYTKTNWKSDYFHLQIYPDSTNTIAYIQKMIELHPIELHPAEK